MSETIMTVCQENQCAGCMACVNTCSQGAITIQMQAMKYNAVIQQNLCVNCGACHKVCPQNNLPNLCEPVSWYQGWSANDEIRKRGTSGGLAGAIAVRFIETGGIVYSCFYQDGEFTFGSATNVDDVKKFAGSKYVKSNPRDCYKEIKDYLKTGRKVLFIGLPCQVAGIKNYCGRKYDDMLFTIDLICHGTPSPILLETFLNQYGYSLDELKDVRFRTKSNVQVYEGYKGIITNGVSDRYLIAFLNSLSYTENCYQCRFARRERVSDITLGDSWGSELSKEETQRGLSLILCMTEKGHNLVKESNLELKPVDLQRAIANNHQLEAPSVKPAGYDAFCEGISQGKEFNRLVTKYLRKPCFRQDVKEILIKMKLIRGG